MSSRPRPRTAAARSHLRELLLAVARGSQDSAAIVRLLSDVQATELAEAATGHRMASLVHLAVKDLGGVPRTHVDALADARYQAQARRVALLHLLARSAEVLDVPVLTIKGHALAANWYPDPSTRDFNDLDILVRPQHFERALKALAKAGMRPATTNWHGFLAYGVAEVPVQFRSFVVDLHWHVVALGRERRHLRLPTAEFFERAVPARFGNLDVLTLGPVDTLLHLCTNTGLSGARQLRGLIDIDTVVRSGRVDMSEFAMRARQTGVGRLCAAILQRSELVLATPIDSGLLAELAGDRSWLTANRLVDRASLRRTSSDNVAHGLLLSSGRMSRRATVAALLHGSRRTALTRMGRTDLTDAGGPLDWARLPADGKVEVHRSNYLNWVGLAAASLEPQAPCRPGPRATLPMAAAHG